MLFIACAVNVNGRSEIHGVAIFTIVRFVWSMMNVAFVWSLVAVHTVHNRCSIRTFGPPRSARPAWLETDTEPIEEVPSSPPGGGLNGEKSNECRRHALINRRGCKARRSSCRGPTIHAIFEFELRRKREKGRGERGGERGQREGFTEGDSPSLNCSD